MKKLFKFFFYTILSLLLLLILAIVLITTIENPNDYKNKITALVQDYTHRTLTLKGNLSWSFYPSLGIKAESVTLSNPAGFSNNTPFLSADNATFSIRVLPLLYLTLSPSVEIDHAQLNLIQQNNANNWTFSSSTPAAPENKTISENKKSSTGLPLGLVISDAKVNLKNSAFTYTSGQTNAKASGINANLGLSGGKISIDSFAAKADNKTIDVTDVELSTSVSGEKAHGKLTVKSINSLGTPGMPITNFSTNYTANIANQEGTLSDVRVTTSGGTIKVDEIRGSAKAASLKNVSAVVLNIGKMLPSSPGAKPTILNKLEIPSATLNLNTLDGQGQVNIASAEAAGVTIDNIQTPFNITNKILTTTPSATLNGASIKADAAYNLNNSDVALKTASVTGLPLEPVLKDLANFSGLKGTANVTVTNLTTNIANPNEMMSRMNATSIHLDITKGSYTGLNNNKLIGAIGYILNATRQQAVSIPDLQSFDKLDSGSISIRKGLVNNEKLEITGKAYITGNGTINLVNHQMDYTLNLYHKKDMNNPNAPLEPLIQDLPSVHLTGPYENPSFARGALKTFAESNLPKLIKKENLPPVIAPVVGQILNQFLGQ